MYKIITEIDDYKPRIWRRILISENTSVTDFAYGIMGIYNAEGYHLWNVESMGQKPPRQRLTWVNAKTYMYVNEDSLDWEDYKNPETHKVSDLFKEKGDIVLVNYDFGDDWCFKCVLEEISEDDGTELPSVLKWKGHGIIEDCGGVWGLEEALEEYGEKIEPWTTESLTDALRLKNSRFPEIYKVMKEESDKIFANPEEYRSPERKKAAPESFLNMIEMINQAVENGDINSLLNPPTKGTVITLDPTTKKVTKKTAEKVAEPAKKATAKTTKKSEEPAKKATKATTKKTAEKAEEPAKKATKKTTEKVAEPAKKTTKKTAEKAEKVAEPAKKATKTTTKKTEEPAKINKKK